MESTAQDLAPGVGRVGARLAPTQRRRADAGPTTGGLHFARAQSNHGRHGRKRDFPDAERLVKRLVAHELTLSFVPDVTQRLWRTVTRRKYQLTRNRVQLQNRLESSSRKRTSRCPRWCPILLVASARRMLQAVATGETDPAAIAALGSPRLHATPEQLCDALGASTEVHPLYRRLIAMTLTELDLLESHKQQLDAELAALLRVHQEAVRRLAAVPGLGVDSAQQIIAQVGPTATTFATAKRLASWVAACPGHEESAGVNRSHRAPHGNRQMRRLLNQAAHAAGTPKAAPSSCSTDGSSAVSATRRPSA